jgi:hypothetical protein
MGKGKKITASDLSKEQQDLLKGYIDIYSRPGIGDEFANMLSTGAPTEGINVADVQAGNIAAARTNLADLLGQTRGQSARSGTFFSTASRGKEADQARRAAEALTMQNAQLGMQGSQFNAQLAEAARQRQLQALLAGQNLAIGNTESTAYIPDQPGTFDFLNPQKW